jgi:hypothetical protein
MINGTEERGNRCIKCYIYTRAHTNLLYFIHLLIYYILFSNRETEYWNKVAETSEELEKRREMKL